MGKDQPRAIIRNVLVVLAYTMHIKFQGHWSIDSGVEDFFSIYGHSGHVGHMTQDHLNTCPFLKALEPDYNRHSSFRGDVV